MSFNNNKSVKKALFSYWDKLQADQNAALLSLINEKPFSSYGENQDFISLTCHTLSMKYGYIRPETASVYFRQYKNKCRKVRDTAKAAISQVGQ